MLFHKTIAVPGLVASVFAVASAIGSPGVPERAASALTAFTARTTTDAYAVKRKWNQTNVDNYNAELKNVKDNCAIMAGTIGMLRWILTDIK
jgi:hypothetical protein